LIDGGLGVTLFVVD